MKKLAVFIIILIILSFSGCGWKVEIVNPNEQIIDSEADIKNDPNPEENSETEETSEIRTDVSESKYSITEICPYLDIGYDGGTLFSGGKLYISTTVYRGENSCDEKLIIDLETGKEYASFGLYLLYGVDRFTDDFNGNVYHLISEYGSDLEGDYEYSLISLDESGNSGDSVNLHFDDDFGIGDITCDINGNWYLGNSDEIHIYDSDFEEIFRFENQNIYSMPSLLRLPDGRCAAVFAENSFEIRIFDPDTFEFSESYPLPYEPNAIFSENSEYDIIFTGIDESCQCSLYGLDFGKEPEFLINFNEYIEGDFAVLEAHINENGDIFIVRSFVPEHRRGSAIDIQAFKKN